MRSSACQIGGVFPLEIASSKTPQQASLYEAWRSLGELIGLFRNGRSAILYTIRNQASQSVWVPAYICDEVISLFDDLNISLKFYGVDEHLSPRIDMLEPQLSAGDSVIFVNYFGKPQSEAFRELVEMRSDVVWIEDCTQTIYYDAPPIGDYLIFSPRKVGGMPDGGILIGRRGWLPAPKLETQRIDDLLKPYELRAAESTQFSNDLWFPAYRYAEARHEAGMVSMSSISLERLFAFDAMQVRLARQRNYSILFDALGDFSLYEEPAAEWTPFGFPVVCRCAGEMQKRLARKSLYAPRHWASLRAPSEHFRVESDLSKRLLTLPCDQRYTSKEMQLVAQIFREEVRVR